MTGPLEGLSSENRQRGHTIGVVSKLRSFHYVWILFSHWIMFLSAMAYRLNLANNRLLIFEQSQLSITDILLVLGFADNWYSRNCRYIFFFIWANPITDILSVLPFTDNRYFKKCRYIGLTICHPWFLLKIIITNSTTYIYIEFGILFFPYVLQSYF